MRTLTIAAALVALAACSSEPRETLKERAAAATTAPPTAPPDPASARARQLEAEIDRLLAEHKVLIERLEREREIHPLDSRMRAVAQVEDAG